MASASFPRRNPSYWRYSLGVGTYNNTLSNVCENWQRPTTIFLNRERRPVPSGLNCPEDPLTFPHGKLEEQLRSSIGAVLDPWHLCHYSIVTRLLLDGNTSRGHDPDHERTLIGRAGSADGGGRLLLIGALHRKFPLPKYLHVSLFWGFFGTRLPGWRRYSEWIATDKRRLTFSKTVRTAHYG
jgi:hypothetical protein